MSFSIPEGYSHSDNIIKSFNWVIAIITNLCSQIWNVILDPLFSLFTGMHYVKHITIGKSTAVRILCGGMHNSRMTSLIRDCIMERKEFGEVFNVIIVHS